MSWNGFGVDPHLNFERKLKMMLHLLRILALNFSSKFQLIQDGCSLKGNSIIYNFFRNRENQISTFSRPKMRFKLLLKIITFFEHFLIFPQDVSVSLSNLFFKNLSSESKGKDKRLEQIWCWSPLEILRENRR